MQSLLVILIVITGIILPTQVKGEREDYILLISSYNSNSSWAKTLEASFRQELKKNDCPYPVYSEYLTYIIHSGFISGYQNRYGDNLKPPTNVYHRMTA